MEVSAEQKPKQKLKLKDIKIATVEAVSDDQVRTCPYQDWYKFKQCTIHTCKNHTTQTAHHCLAVDRVQPTGNKIISDAEIHYYKFHAEGISTKYVSIKRKEAMGRVVAILALRSFIEYLKEKYDEEKPIYYVHKKIAARELAYPLKIGKLQFENWMWKYITDPKVFRQFRAGKSGGIKEIAHCELLDVTPAKLEILDKLTKELEKCQRNKKH